MMASRSKPVLSPYRCKSHDRKITEHNVLLFHDNNPCIFFQSGEGSKTLWFGCVLYDSISSALIEEWKMKQSGFFDVEERLAQLSGLGD